MASKNDGKNVGDVCAYNPQHTLVAGKNGAYCKTCYIEYKNKQGGNTQPIPLDTKREEGLSWGNAKNCAATLMQGKEYTTKEEAMMTFRWFVDQIYKMKPVNGNEEEVVQINSEDSPPF